MFRGGGRVGHSGFQESADPRRRLTILGKLTNNSRLFRRFSDNCREFLAAPGPVVAPGQR
ncbi:hypothetical protein DESUT3_15690 [Desulfuromonas versatilis]|uniref:Uncharacterized protein n=1 Tax=Desulfuromonas versatilis TaxID=2802975 RepID=A0ABN6DWR6_9BACT|nr:hypothetical protein DESUT3_15690 [Desulfuromonas versatilis]